VHLVRAHSELRQLDRLFKAVYESLAGLTAAAAAAAIASSAGSSRDEMRSVAERQAVTAAGVMSSRSFVAAVRLSVADAPTGEGVEWRCFSTELYHGC
jgi:methylphosphotriester-DNA--protein-cysteine methyltransferase